jgi:alanine dehydrogenase
MLFISDEEVQATLEMEPCIDAMERAFTELGEGIAVSHPRQRYRVARGARAREAREDRGGDAAAYMANIIPGAVPGMGVAALRYDSTVMREREVAGGRRLEFLYPSGRSWGFVLLFSLETAEPLAVIQDFSLSALRVGATTGVAVRVLARSDASVVGLFGSGNEARRNLEAICCVRRVAEVRVFSPSQEHREAFAAEASQRLSVPVRPAVSPREVVDGADVVMCATNSSQPVFDGAWLTPGQMVATIANTDHVQRRTEADETTFRRADLIVVNHRQTVVDNRQRELLDLLEDGRVPEDRVCELAEVLTGARPGRRADTDIIYYKSNTGVGIQFAAAGALILAACRQRGLGREVPTEWFGADVRPWLDRGFLPSP